MFGIGVQELAIIFVVALLIFGPKRLPELARTLGKGLAEFRRASSDLRHSFDLAGDDRPPPPVPRATDEKVDLGERRELDSRPQQIGGDLGHDEDATSQTDAGTTEESKVANGDAAAPEPGTTR